ncbi:hypothetical protein C8J57DRAFT_1612816 [Mycena rebaudengoi]|nr:hypothetical protein C8J57DRAFT_1612816 [Mycena rebaudengoi]
MSFANHGKCLNDGPPVARPELAKCVVCVFGCYAAQHIDMNGAQHRIKFTTQDPYSALDPEGTVVDSIHVQPAKTLKNDEELPPRFDTALVNDGPGKIMAGSISRGTNSSCLLTSSPPQIVDFLVSDNASVDAPCEFRWPLGKQFCRTVPIKKMLHKWAEDNTLNELAAHNSGDDLNGLELRITIDKSQAALSNYLLSPIWYQSRKGNHLAAVIYAAYAKCIRKRLGY